MRLLLSFLRKEPMPYLRLVAGVHQTVVADTRLLRWQLRGCEWQVDRQRFSLSPRERFHEPPRLTNCFSEPPLRKSLEIKPTTWRFMGRAGVRGNSGHVIRRCKKPSCTSRL